MHFAQKQVGLQHGLIQSVRGTLLGADICEYKDAVSASWDASFVQLSAGNLDANIEFLAGDDFVLYRESWHQQLHLVGTLLPGMIAIGIPAGTGHDTRWWGQTISTTCIPIARSTDELNLVTGTNEAITVLTMSEQDFLRIFERLTGLHQCDFPGGGHFLVVKTDAVQRIRHFWNSVLAHTLVMDVCAWSVVDLLAPLLDALEMPVISHHVEAPKAALLDRIMRIAEASEFRASVPEISLALNVSRRTIEYVFQDLMGESPRAYFTLRRLNFCKQELLEASHGETTVAAIATKHGFYELGRFASVYRHYFGELPSNTLRRARGLVAVGVQPIAGRTIQDTPSVNVSREALIVV